MSLRLVGAAACLVLAAAFAFPAQLAAGVLAGQPAGSCVEALQDLPLVEEPAVGEGGALAIMLSGDGGWAALDRGVADELTRAGVFVVGVNSFHYFRKGRTPEGTARDLERVVRCYSESTGRRQLVLLGYSRGAEIMPFVVTRLPEDLRRETRLVALLGPGEGAQFQFHLVDLWKDVHRASDFPVLPEARHLVSETPVLCIYGAEEKDTVCPALRNAGAQAVELAGGHHFDGGYDELGQVVLRALTASAGEQHAARALVRHN